MLVWSSGAAVFTTDSVEVKDKLAYEILNLTGCCAASSEAAGKA